jgi:hypothetical protein
VKILDISAGQRAVWFDKNHPDATYVDVRPEVRPTVVADARELPPIVGAGFGLVVFDPPHVNGGKNGNISRDYGHHTSEEIRDIIRRSAQEAHRVTSPDALMAFKWNDHDQKLPRVLALMADWWEPLFGHVTSVRKKHVCQTYWVMLRRRDAAQPFALAAE